MRGLNKLIPNDLRELKGSLERLNGEMEVPRVMFRVYLLDYKIPRPLDKVYPTVLKFMGNYHE